MFYEFSNQVWTPGTGITIENNTDTSIDGSCKKITWSDALGEIATISFDAVDLSTWEEISFYVYTQGQLGEDELFTITIDSETYTFTNDHFRHGIWNHVLIDCSSMGSVSSIVIESSVEDLVLMIDYIGYRKVTYDCDNDVVTALKNFINLDYDVSTTLSDDADIGDTEVSLTSNVYITDNSILQIDDGNGTIETVELISRDGDISNALSNAFSSGDTVRVICPVRDESSDSLEPDPLCGIMVYDFEADKQMTVVKVEGGSKIKEYLGSIGICIYIDCSHKKKLLKMAREYNRKYGKEFLFLLDGEQVEMYMYSKPLFNDGMLGSNHRIAYYYRFDPQPYLLVNRDTIDTFNITLEPVHPEEIS